MARKLPRAPITYPSGLNLSQNGRLPLSDLVRLTAHNGGADVLLLRPAARAWLALTSAALEDGHTLKTSHLNSSYRPYADQERIFLDRYVPSVFGTKRWNGKRWRKRFGVPTAAVPGTSNHGLGLAVDTGEERDGDAGAESIDAETLDWLIDNAHRFGFSAEIQSEPWHWRYVTGDRVPAEVLAFEARMTPQGGDEMKQVNDPNRRRLFTVFTTDGTTTVREHGTYLPDAGEMMPNVSYVIDEQVAKGHIKKVS